MKNMLKNKDGYVLAYVVVVIAVVSLIAVAACTATVRNYKSQSAALAYTQEKYAAEGIVERFVAELKDGVLDVALKADERIGNGLTKEKLIDTNTNGFAYLLQTDFYALLTEITEEEDGKNDKADCACTQVIISDDNTLYFEMDAKTQRGNVELVTEIVVSFHTKNVENSAELYELDGVSFECKSYDLSVSTGTEVAE